MYFDLTQDESRLSILAKFEAQEEIVERAVGLVKNDFIFY